MFSITCRVKAPPTVLTPTIAVGRSRRMHAAKSFDGGPSCANGFW
jgi:hypothetical protein